MTSSTHTPGSKVGRARRRFSQLWQVPAFLFGLLAFLGVAVSAPWRHPPQWWDFDTQLIALRQGLEQNAPANQLVLQAELLDTRLERFPERAPEAHFLIGSTYYRQGRQTEAARAREIWPHAEAHLEKAHGRDLPDADRLPLQYRLGYCLYQQKKEVPRAIELMMLSVDKGAEQPLAGYRLLIDANLGRTPPNLESALAASRRILDLTPERDFEAVALARVQHAELLLRKSARAEAVKELERVSKKASPKVRIQARLLQTRAHEEDGLWQKAIVVWQDLLADAAQVKGGKARILFAMGWCYHQMEPPDHAETMRVWAEALKLGGPEGQAAGLRLGELRLSMGKEYAPQAVADWKQALANVNGPRDFNNPHVKLAEMRALFDHAIKYFHGQQDPQSAQHVAELYRKIAPSDVAVNRLAQAAEELAEQLQDKLKNKIGMVTAQEVEAQFRRAGEAYELIAKTLPEDQRAASLWRSAQCYLSAKEVPLAQKILAEHVKIEKNEARVAEAWFLLGELYRTQGDKDLSRKAFYKCIEIPDTLFASRSRFFLALDEIEKEHFDQAEKILDQNLIDRNNEIDRPAHEKSLYKMAWVKMKLKKYDEAQIYLKESERLYPENPNALLAREQLGECYRRLAEKEQTSEREVVNQIRAADLSEERRQTLEETARQHKKVRIDWLRNAVKTYQSLTDDLQRQAQRQPLNGHEQMVVRRAAFGIGDCLFDAEDFGEALRVFQKLQNDHRRTVESMYACLRVYATVEALRPSTKDEADLTNKAMAAIRLLLEDLKELPADNEIFRLQNIWPREQWLRWADTTKLRLLAPPKKDRPLPAFR